jgi:glucose-1-phosphate thymidylyltransferase
LRRIVGLVPAAGYATRLQPLPTSKEVISVGGRPVMDYLLERMRAAPADEVRVITRPDKLDVVAHARERGAEVVEGHPASVSESLLLGMAGLEPDDVVLIGFPDCLWEPVDGFRQLVGALDDGHDVALGLFLFHEIERSDAIAFDAEGRVAGVAVKTGAPPSPWIWGCAVARVRALGGLRDDPEPGVLFDRLARAGGIASVVLSDRFEDIGTPASLAAALEGAGSAQGGPSPRR